jgi:hypothetical protein
VLHRRSQLAVEAVDADRWRALACELRGRGQRIVWSAGPREEALVEACSPVPEGPGYRGRLDLASYGICSAAQASVAPDTGVPISADCRHANHSFIRAGLGGAGRRGRLLAATARTRALTVRAVRLPRPATAFQARSPLGARVQALVRRVHLTALHGGDRDRRSDRQACAELLESGNTLPCTGNRGRPPREEPL